ncbi:patatin-like phospholipase family protein [Polyangium jinanense]|uniref:Patatin-like phospholipase family protein n=1 Tax=Polyangium jinanense TaxID=2829994 RepID=A0A9X3X9K7_9BACT|nr:patatin-like phospholipase family protein [Polyangium jinanense]MDC3959066.1 patatin-like phospholipase family protein [Polyangium jinanense]MDC3984011.1 patatin-like phospholipase family protein [Polyangium jinanense]
MKIENLVFEGGGMKGIAYAGAIGELERRGVLGGVTQVAGASAGAITAALLAVGVDAAELEKILRETDFTKFMDGKGWVFGGASRLFEAYGVHPGKTAEDWLRNQIAHLTERLTGRAQPDLTFAELSALATAYPGRARNLYVVTTNLSQRIAEVFSAASRPDVPVYKAVRMSMSIPLFFEAYPFHGDLYVDGGVSWNYPIDLFDGVHKTPVLGADPHAPAVQPATLGFCLGTKAENDASLDDWRLPRMDIKDFETYAKALTSFIISSSTLLHLDEAALARTIFIDDAGVATTEFKLSKEMQDKLVANGAAAAKEWFERG